MRWTMIAIVAAGVVSMMMCVGKSCIRLKSVVLPVSAIAGLMITGTIFYWNRSKADTTAGSVETTEDPLLFGAGARTNVALESYSYPVEIDNIRDILASKGVEYVGGDGFRWARNYNAYK